VRLRPDLAEDIRTITDRYLLLRYGGDSTPAQVEELRKLVARFRPTARS